jgi:hypothetical protein
VKGYLDEVTSVAAAPVIEKYTGVLAAADVFTERTTFWVMESIRLDLAAAPRCIPDGERGDAGAIIGAVGQEVMQRAESPG